MDRTTIVKPARSLALAASALLLTWACAGQKPVAEMARAEQAVRHAETTSEAQRLAPSELSLAQTKLASARRAVDDHEYEDARRLAEEALADAQLAESKAESKIARDQAVRTRQDIQALQTEALSPSTVVIERRQTVQRTVPTTVIVERPAPPAENVVIQRDEPVVVVPE